MVNRRTFLKNMVLAATNASAVLAGGETVLADDPMALTDEHIKAAGRQRRLVVNYDALAQLFGYKPPGGKPDIESLKSHLLSLLDLPGNQIDSVGWCWSEGNEAPYPSKVLPTLLDHPIFKFVPEGLDIVRLCCDETRRRGIESFFSYRINGGDHDRGPAPKLPKKWENKDWLINWNPDPNGPPEYIAPYHLSAFWNFAAKGTRDYKVRALVEVAENYAFDGIEVDYARNSPVLQPGHQWENREALTDFMRSLRRALQEVAKKRGRPVILGARVPETIVGCHFDGIDVETWVRERMVDVLVLGCRAMEVDIASFRLLTDGTRIKIYLCTDFHHIPDGYNPGEARICRGIYSNWWHQRPDGVCTFNYTYSNQDWSMYREIGSPETLRFTDKIFAIQRRGGGHHPVLTPYPSDWSTPRLAYANTNMLGQLPVTLDPAARADNLLFLYVADGVSSAGARLKSLKLRVQLSRPAPIELRLNGGLLDTLKTDKEDSAPPMSPTWAEFSPPTKLFAIGQNLVSIRFTAPRAAGEEAVNVEKVEVHVEYM
ncbi:MAG: hypothetical protein HY717_09390 [Planctomycetes bacterium]|nr:hypothetical protein [Planctomycetota bacterium]